MESENDLFERVSRYLNHKLSAGEREAFEAQYEQDPAFAEEVDRHKESVEMVERYGMLRAKEAFKERYEQVKQEKRVRVIPVWSYAAAAAVVLLLIFIPLRTMYFSPTASMEDLYVSHFEMLPASGDRDTVSTSGNTWWEAQQAYSKGTYEQAVTLLKPLSEDPQFPDQSEASLYLGLSYMALEQAAQAVKSFERVAAKSSFHQDAQWYRALAWLQLKEKEKTIAAFSLIRDAEHHYYKERAQEILKALGE